MVNQNVLDTTFFALSSATRRRTLSLVRQQPRRLVDVAGALDISLPALHKHIDILERAKLINKRKVGRERFVMTNLQNLTVAEKWIAEHTKYWDKQLASLEHYIEQMDRTK